MSIRTGTEEKQQKPRSRGSTSALWKSRVSGGDTRPYRPLFVHPSHPAVAEHHSREPFHRFSRTEHQLLSSKLISCKLSELGDVLVIISYIAVY